MRAAHPQVLAVTGPHAYEEVMAAVHAQLPPPHEPFSSLVPPQGIKLTPRHYAYLKISEGCNHRCSFCIIPSLRGDLVEPAHRRGDARGGEPGWGRGARAAGGLPGHQRLRGRPQVPPRLLAGPARWRTRLQPLAAALGELGVWVRMHYVYPYPHVDDLIPLMAEGRILPYLDVPLQHGSPRILKAMRRPAASEKALERIQRWREICPELTIRSTFIVGFPGETEAEFAELLEFVREARTRPGGLLRLLAGGGAAANQLPDPVPEVGEAGAPGANSWQVQSEISTRRLAEQGGAPADRPGG